MPDLDVWPSDGSAGAVSTEARWRKMARLWAPSGVRRDADLVPTLVAGPTINVSVGQAFIDGHLAELTSPASVPAAADGIVVIRWTPADNRAELLFRAGAGLTPTQTDASWELPIAVMVGGGMADRRPILATATELSGAATSGVSGVTAIWPATSAVVPGIQVVLYSPGLYLLTACFDMEVTVAAAGNLAYGMIVPTGAVLPLAGTIPNRIMLEMGQLQRRMQQLTLPCRVDTPGTAFVNLCASKAAAGGTYNVLSNALGTWLHAHRIAA